MSKVFQAVIAEQSEQTILFQSHSEFVEIFGKAKAKKLLQGILRFAFFVEPVKKPKIETTKYAVRWGQEVIGDPRYAGYESCLEIFGFLLRDILEKLSNLEGYLELINLFLSRGAIAYDLPLDYISQRQDKIHQLENIQWLSGEFPSRVAELRVFLVDTDRSELADFFKSAYEKIFVKSFLTDRTLTGDHKTNREKRWEVHPGSVHFALRRDCMAIEEKLVTQLCYFEGFPEELRALLEEMGLISFQYLDESRFPKQERLVRCPITLAPLSFDEFRDELLNPRHGKASYQVGHLHPLKAISDNSISGQKAENISWISSQGNRIQGELSVEETRSLIFQIVENYKRAGFIK